MIGKKPPLESDAPPARDDARSHSRELMFRQNGNSAPLPPFLATD